MVSVYVIEGRETGKRYVGITRQLARRLAAHARKASEGGQIIGGFALLHTEEFPDYATAREREQFLKSGQGRRWLAERYPRTRPAGGG